MKNGPRRSMTNRQQGHGTQVFAALNVLDGTVIAADVMTRQRINKFLDAIERAVGWEADPYDQR